jgi:hypothetical protein
VLRCLIFGHWRRNFDPACWCTVARAAIAVVNIPSYVYGVEILCNVVSHQVGGAGRDRERCRLCFEVCAWRW